MEADPDPEVGAGVVEVAGAVDMDCMERSEDVVGSSCIVIVALFLVCWNALDIG